MIPPPPRSTGISHNCFTKKSVSSFLPYRASSQSASTASRSPVRSRRPPPPLREGRRTRRADLYLVQITYSSNVYLRSQYGYVRECYSDIFAHRQSNISEEFDCGTCVIVGLKSREVQKRLLISYHPPFRPARKKHNVICLSAALNAKTFVRVHCKAKLFSTIFGTQRFSFLTIIRL